MRGREPLYGYVVAFELLVASILNFIIIHGKGAPAHPNSTLHAVGVAASLALIPLIRTNNRTIVGLGAIVAAFCVTGLAPGPTSLGVVHFVALAIAVVYALLLTNRQRRATPRTARGQQATRSSRASGRKSKKEPVPAGPRPSARYTPPKKKR